MTLWSRASRYAFALSGALSLSLTASADCHHPRCSTDLNQSTLATLPVIVQYANEPSEAEVAAVSSIGAVYHRNHSIHTVGAVIPTTQLETLASRPGVAYVSLDRPVVAHQMSSSSSPIGRTPEFTAEPINAPWAWSKGFDGQGIGIAVIDSGITPSADFSVTSKSATPLPGSPTAALQSEVQALASSIVPGGPIVGAQNGNSQGNNGNGNGNKTAATPAASIKNAVYTGRTRIVYSYNFTSDNPTDTLDSYGHGTHVAGLIAGNGSNSTGSQYSRTFKGIAPNANLINLRVLDANGQGTDSSVIAAIQAAIQLKSTYNIRIINLSLGRPIFEGYAQDPLCQAVEQAWKAGIVVMVAAGNDGRDVALNSEGYGTINAPGNDPRAITIGAANPNNTAGVNDDVMASYSSKGPSSIDLVAKPDLIAPGNLVTSVLAPSSNLQLNNPMFYTPDDWYITGAAATASQAYFPLSGTSMATAVASGAVADLMEAASYLTPDQVKVLLMASANKSIIPALNVVTDPVSGVTFTAHNDPLTQGAGYLDLQATINNVWNFAWTLPAAASAASPATSYNAANGTVTLVPATGSVWTTNIPVGSTALWGAASVYGSNAFDATAATALWGRTAIAGSSDAQAFTALWGRKATSASSILWSSGSTDAQTALWGRDTTSTAGTTAGSTALWGRQTSNGSTALWGRQTSNGSTALWGRSSSTGVASASGPNQYVQ